MKRWNKRAQSDTPTLQRGTDQSCLSRLCTPGGTPVAGNPQAPRDGCDTSAEPRRDADRLASLGMLAAGLGHDMGNLLPIVRVRLDTLGHMDLPEAAIQEIRAIAEACEYLKNLCRGLRHFLDPNNAAPSADQTELATWWAEVAPFMRNVLPRAFELSPPLFRHLPSVAISPHALTQVVYNLVQNAGDAMAGRTTGRVTISATVAEDGRSVVLDVADDGPGMSDEVLRHCLDPFVTTKARGTSSGLGLALVQNAIGKAGGSVAIHSRLGEGTEFLLTLRVRNPESCLREQRLVPGRIGNRHHQGTSNQGVTA